MKAKAVMEIALAYAITPIRRGSESGSSTTSAVPAVLSVVHRQVAAQLGHRPTARQSSRGAR